MRNVLQKRLKRLVAHVRNTLTRVIEVILTACVVFLGVTIVWQKLNGGTVRCRRIINFDVTSIGVNGGWTYG